MKLVAWAVGITAGSREVPGRNACDKTHPYCIIIIICRQQVVRKVATHSQQHAVYIPQAHNRNFMPCHHSFTLRLGQYVISFIQAWNKKNALITIKSRNRITILQRRQIPQKVISHKQNKPRDVTKMIKPRNKNTFLTRKTPLSEIRRTVQRANAKYRAPVAGTFCNNVTTLLHVKWYPT